MKSFSNLKKTAIPIAIVAAFAAVITACAGTGRAGPQSHIAEPVVIGRGGEWELNGMLTMPVGAGAGNRVPAVVLVHGSGPGDMDLTVGENRPFLDIAGHLSDNGIAAIRYDKRTLAHGPRMLEELGGSLTVREETIEDAILAARLLMDDPRVDANRVYLLGISMGGMLAPRIHAEEGGNFAGLILLAGTPRLLSDILIEQLRTSFGIALEDGPEKTLQLAQLDSLAQMFAAIPGMSDEQARATPSIGGGSAYYFKDLMTHPFADYAKALDVPVLVMQGGSDFQVLADVDFAMLRELFAGRDNVAFKLYEGLNHLFMPSVATNFVEHATEIMETAGNVDGRVLRDITDWILSR